MSTFSGFIEGLMGNLEGTTISDMEGIGFISNEGLGEYLGDVIPPTHIDECPLIDFEPNHLEFGRSPNALAFYVEDTNEIRISDRFSNPEEFLDTVIHEVGHNEYFNDFSENPENRAKWEGLHLATKEQYERFGIGCVSDYAATCPEEDFAESYAMYVRDPELLQWHSAEKYDLMKEVFDGREYQPMTYIGNDAFVLEKPNTQQVFVDSSQLETEDFWEIVKGGDMQNLGQTIHCFDKVGAD